MIALVLYFQEEVAKYDKICEDAYMGAKKVTAIHNIHWLDSPWTGFFENRDPMVMPTTGISTADLDHIGKAISTVPPDFALHGGQL